jgi:tetratricopeptide (TPR) repeat protein
VTEPVTEPETGPRLPGPTTAKALVLIAVIGLFAYFNSLHGAFVLDDGVFLSDPNLAHPFQSVMVRRPVIALSLWLNYRLDGGNPRGYHLLNLTVHVLAAMILFDLVRRTLLLPHFGGRFDPWGGWVALVTSLVWLVHPLQTQSVTYIVQRCESMMGLFFLLSLWAFVRGATATRGRWWYVLAVTSCAIGAGCKEMMLTLPPLVLLYDRTFLAGSWWAAIRNRWVVLLGLCVPPLIGIGALVLTGFLTDPRGTVGFGVKVYTPYSYALTQTEVVLHYLKLSVWPVGLTLDYLDWFPRQSLADAWPTVAAIAGLLLAVMIGIFARTAWGFLGAWFFLILAPTSSVIPLQDAAFEHRMYLSLAAVVVLVVCGLARAGLWFGQRTGLNRVTVPTLGVAAGVLVLVLAFLTVVRNEDYASPARLYADNVAKRPANGRVRLNLAVQLFAAGNVTAADEQLDAAARLPLQVPTVQSERVKVFRESGRVAEAAVLAKQLLDRAPEDAPIAYELGLCLLTDSRPAEALPHLRQMAEKAPQNQFARAHYGIALLETGHIAEAEAEFRAANDINPEYAAQLAQTARRAALNPDARPANLQLVRWYADAACRMKPAAPAEFHDTHAICLARVGLFTEAKIEAGLAADLARARGDDYLASRIDARARLFESRKPYLPD